MVLLLTADMVRGMLVASVVRRERPQWTIQVYTPPRAWPFSTSAVLAVMWHLAPENAPTGTAEEIARDLHAWAANQDFPWRRPRGGLPVAPAAEGFSLAATLQRHPDKRARHFLQTGTVLAAPPNSEWRWDAGGGTAAARPLDPPAVVLAHGHPGPWCPSHQGGLPTGTTPRRGPVPQSAGGGGLDTVARGGQAPEPVFPPGAGPGTTSRRGHGDRGVGGDHTRHGMQVDHRGRPAAHAIAAGVPPPSTGVPSLGPRHSLMREVWRAMLSHLSEWMTSPGARYPPGPVLEQLTAPTPRVRHTLHRASALTEQLTDEVLDLAPEPLRLLYPQTHIPPAGTSNRLGRLGLQRRVEAAHPGGVVEQWLALHIPSSAQGHWYLHHLRFLPRTTPEHRQQNPYHTHPECLGAQSFPQPASPALPPGQGPEELQQGPSLDMATTVQQGGSSNADGAEPDRTKCGVVAWTAGCRHLARDTAGIRQYRPADRTTMASTVAAVTMKPLAAWPVPLLLHVPCRNTRPRQPAATHTPTTPLTAEQLYVVAAALLADGGESFLQHHGPAQIAESIQGPQRGVPHPWHTDLRERTHVRYAGGGTHPPRPQQGEALVLQTAGYQAILQGHAGGYRSHILAGGRWTVWHGTARQGAFPPHVDWQQEPTWAYYMTADPCPLAVLLHTVSAPSKWQEPRWTDPPTLVWSPDQEEHLRAAWQGDAIRATDVPHLHEGPTTHARRAATLAVAQRGQQNPQSVVCMFSPADAHIAVCGPGRLPGPEAVICVEDCAHMIVKALREGEHHALLLQVCLRNNAKAAKPGVWPAAAPPADLELQLAVQPRYTTGYRPSTTCDGGASPNAKSVQRTGKSRCRQTRSATPSRVPDPRPRREPSTHQPRAAH